MFLTTCAKSLQSCLTLWDPMDCSPPDSSAHGILQARILEWVAMPSSKGSSQPRSPALQVESLPSEPPRKLPNKGSLSLLQRIFLAQELSCGLLHRRQILYQLSYSVQFSSVAQSCPTLCDPMNCSMPGLPVHHQLPESTQTHAHRVSDAIQPSHPLSFPSPPAPSPSQHQGLFQ